MSMFQVVQVRIIYVVLTHSGMIAEIIIIDKSLFFFDSSIFATSFFKEILLAAVLVPMEITRK